MKMLKRLYWKIAGEPPLSALAQEVLAERAAGKPVEPAYGSFLGDEVCVLGSVLMPAGSAVELANQLKIAVVTRGVSLGMFELDEVLLNEFEFSASEYRATNPKKVDVDYFSAKMVRDVLARALIQSEKGMTWQQEDVFMDRYNRVVRARIPFDLNALRMWLMEKQERDEKSQRTYDMKSVGEYPNTGKVRRVWFAGQDRVKEAYTIWKLNRTRGDMGPVTWVPDGKELVRPVKPAPVDVATMLSRMDVAVDTMRQHMPAWREGLERAAMERAAFEQRMRDNETTLNTAVGSDEGFVGGFGGLGGENLWQGEEALLR